jgi:hypothetical protein
MHILMHRADTWTWTKADITRQVAAEMRFLRSMEDKIKNEEKERI